MRAYGDALLATGRIAGSNPFGRALFDPLAQTFLRASSYGRLQVPVRYGPALVARRCIAGSNPFARALSRSVTGTKSQGSVVLTAPGSGSIRSRTLLQEPYPRFESLRARSASLGRSISQGFVLRTAPGSGPIRSCSQLRLRIDGSNRIRRLCLILWLTPFPLRFVLLTDPGSDPIRSC